MKFKISAIALSQYRLILEHDFKIAGPYLRITIIKKGCNGFEYGVACDQLKAGDVSTWDQDGMIEIIQDQMCAFYLQDFAIDYMFDPSTMDEGFVITNHHEKNYHGKFFNKSPELTMPMAP